jgi:HEPN domain-containing protein
MLPITSEWISKAEADFGTLQREIQVVDYPNYDGVCFHAQQCAEKYLKGRLRALVSLN